MAWPAATAIFSLACITQTCQTRTLRKEQTATSECFVNASQRCKATDRITDGRFGGPRRRNRTTGAAASAWWLRGATAGGSIGRFMSECCFRRGLEKKETRTGPDAFTLDSRRHCLGAAGAVDNGKAVGHPWVMAPYHLSRRSLRKIFPLIGQPSCPNRQYYRYENTSLTVAMAGGRRRSRCQWQRRCYLKNGVGGGGAIRSLPLGSPAIARVI